MIGNVITGESLVVTAMGHGREAAQRVHEFLMNLEDQHVSLYERYFTQRPRKNSTDYDQDLQKLVRESKAPDEIPPL
jgi:hypothetical protein